MKRRKIIVIIVFALAIFLMAVGYSAFATQLTLNGTAEITGEWNVKITNIEIKEMSKGCQSLNTNYTNTTASFNAQLLKPGDHILYVITIENAGTINAVLDSAKFISEENSSPAITYNTTEPAKFLEAKQTTTFTVEVVYNKDTTEIPEIKTKTLTGIIEYVQEI